MLAPVLAFGVVYDDGTVLKSRLLGTKRKRALISLVSIGCGRSSISTLHAGVLIVRGLVRYKFVVGAGESDAWAFSWSWNLEFYNRAGGRMDF